MKYLILILMLIPSVALATEARLTNGKPEFAAGTVNGVTVWSTPERDALVAKLDVFSGTSPVSVVNFTPSNFEVSVATSGIEFAGYTDFKKCLDDREYLRDKLEDLKPSVTRKNQATVNFVTSENNKR